MSRARNIKPGFFKNEYLAELPFEYRILFIGLWTLADRAGRMEDRPKRIKMEIFPGDSVDVELGLDALNETGFINRYIVDGERFIQILGFAKHQNPHPREAASVIPEYCQATCKARPRQDQGKTKALPSPAGSSDSPSLIPDSKEKTAPKGDLLEGIDEQLAKDFRTLRTKLRAPITETVMDGFRREAGKAGVTLQDAVRISCERGWRGFKADWLKEKTGNARGGSTGYVPLPGER